MCKDILCVQYIQRVGVASYSNKRLHLHFFYYWLICVFTELNTMNKYAQDVANPQREKPKGKLEDKNMHRQEFKLTILL